MTDTKPMAPTDAELDELRQANGGKLNFVTFSEFRTIARAVLAKWGAPQQEAQQPCQTCAALARTVMLDQVSFDRKPDCYGIRRVTDDEGIEEWEDIRTSPDVAREEANDMMATGRGEIYEVVPLYTPPQPVQVQAHAGMVPLTKEQRSRIVLTVNTVSDAIDMVERHHGITGGQHGAE